MCALLEGWLALPGVVHEPHPVAIGTLPDQTQCLFPASLSERVLESLTKREAEHHLGESDEDVHDLVIGDGGAFVFWGRTFRHSTYVNAGQVSVTGVALPEIEAAMSRLRAHVMDYPLVADRDVPIFVGPALAAEIRGGETTLVPVGSTRAIRLSATSSRSGASR